MTIWLLVIAFVCGPYPPGPICIKEIRYETRESCLHDQAIIRAIGLATMTMEAGPCLPKYAESER
jgi:hypothetical protein